MSGEWSQRSPQRWSRANAYLIDSKLDLWSNFTFCLSDLALAGNCNRGDQFEQADARKVHGFNLATTWYDKLGGLPADFTLGLQTRVDVIDKVVQIMERKNADVFSSWNGDRARIVDMERYPTALFQALDQMEKR